ncbi:valine--tRNA ligase, mitochondrial, partial [Passer montanus]|uniref:valine--tRNA ligase, mitochondrial n=1 Tax=Passer montanus TaxID=9160 RepID=UPI00195FEC40
ILLYSGSYWSILVYTGSYWFLWVRTGPYWFILVPQAPQGLPKGWSPQAEVEYRHPLEPGGKKATGVPLPPRYSPRYVEAAWYQWWERGGVFSPPPPEQDALVRWRRMQGWSVLWVPGTDHAGIATQAIVERWLWQQRRLRRQDLGRAEFLREVWRWKERHGDEILQQLRALGASLDWSRCAFTMDPGFSRAVTEAFVRLFRAGLIRRDQRVVTWSCALRSALADIEVEPRVLTGPTALNVPNCPHPVTFGVLVTFAYPVEGDDGLEVPVATTRPETLFGDVAVAVHPRDPRYQVGAGPSLEGRGVSPGAVKVTPGHSPQDLALARAHALPLLSVIADDGTLCPPGGGWLQGVPRFEARARVVAALAQRGLLRGVQDHAMTLPLCSRSGDVVEFLLKRQWFLSCGDMARGALQTGHSEDKDGGRVPWVVGVVSAVVGVSHGWWAWSQQWWACPRSYGGGLRCGGRAFSFWGQGLFWACPSCSGRGSSCGGRVPPVLGVVSAVGGVSQVLWVGAQVQWVWSHLFWACPSCSGRGLCSGGRVLAAVGVSQRWWAWSPQWWACPGGGGRVPSVPISPPRRDWCLSRQLWWGHQVPAYQVRGGPAPACPQGGPRGPQGGPQGGPQEEGPWFVGRSEAEARAAAAGALGCPPEELHLQQDPDVLDTWFSSALFPFAALGWPEQSPDLARFYPNSVLVTGSDLLFFWVARMAMLGQQLTGQLPFAQVLLHSLVRDPQGRKMSKSLGNVIDPRDVIGGATLQELQEKLQTRTLDPQELQAAQEGQVGRDPKITPEFHLALSTRNAHGPEIRVGVASVLTQRRFCNKIWNAVGFVLRALQGERDPPKPPEEVVPLAPLDRWLLAHLAAAVAECGRRMEALEVQGAVAAVQSFWLRSFCDVYLEVAKGSLRCPELRAGALATLVAAAELGLRLLAPFAPFVAEELWQRLPRGGGGFLGGFWGSRGFPVWFLGFPGVSCVVFGVPGGLSPVPPQARWRSPELEAQVAAMLELVRAVRGLREALRLGGAARPPVLVQGPELAHDWLEQLGPAFRTLSGAGPVQLLPPGAEPGPGWAGAPAASGTFVHLSLQGAPDRPREPRGTAAAPAATSGTRVSSVTCVSPECHLCHLCHLCHPWPPQGFGDSGVTTPGDLGDTGDSDVTCLRDTGDLGDVGDIGDGDVTAPGDIPAFGDSDVTALRDLGDLGDSDVITPRGAGDGDFGALVAVACRAGGITITVVAPPPEEEEAPDDDVIAYDVTAAGEGGDVTEGRGSPSPPPSGDITAEGDVTADVTGGDDVTSSAPEPTLAGDVIAGSDVIASHPGGGIADDVTTSRSDIAGDVIAPGCDLIDDIAVSRDLTDDVTTESGFPRDLDDVIDDVITLHDLTDDVIIPESDGTDDIIECGFPDDVIAWGEVTAPPSSDVIDGAIGVEAGIDDVIGICHAPPLPGDDVIDDVIPGGHLLDDITHRDALTDDVTESDNDVTSPGLGPLPADDVITADDVTSSLLGDVTGDLDAAWDDLADDVTADDVTADDDVTPFLPLDCPPGPEDIDDDVTDDVTPGAEQPLLGTAPFGRRHDAGDDVSDDITEDAPRGGGGRGHPGR